MKESVFASATSAPARLPPFRTGAKGRLSRIPYLYHIISLSRIQGKRAVASLRAHCRVRFVFDRGVFRRYHARYDIFWQLVLTPKTELTSAFFYCILIYVAEMPWTA
jgi:hypothetical protein